MKLAELERVVASADAGFLMFTHPPGADEATVRADVERMVQGMREQASIIRSNLNPAVWAVSDGLASQKVGHE